MMKIRQTLIVSLIGVFFVHYSYSNTIEIKDMVSRTINVPNVIHKIYCSTPVSSTIIYTIDPELLIDYLLNLRMSSEYFPESYLNLPILGVDGFGKGNAVNIEEIIKLKPDIILSTAGLLQAEKRPIEEQA
ncbi:hypothetical protein P4S72_16390 [Vibrio sp. PP-XX7]